LASPSAARCAYMLWCKETLSILLACGSEERAHERLGRAMSLSAETPLFGWQVCCRVVIVMERKWLPTESVEKGVQGKEVRECETVKGKRGRRGVRRAPVRKKL